MSAQNPGATAAAAEKPVLLEAINLTFRTMERRSRHYRNLVIAVSLTAMASVILAVIFRRWVVLSTGFALPLYVGGFLFLDHRLVTTWRRRVLHMRDKRGLSLAQLAQILSGLRHLPQASLRSMLAALASERART